MICTCDPFEKCVYFFHMVGNGTHFFLVLVSNLCYTIL